MTSPSVRSRTWLLALAAVVIVAPLGLRSLEDKDYLRYAEVAREILELGDWSSLHLHGAPYLSKPPLHFWLIAALSTCVGAVGTWTARLPSALAAVGTMLLTCRIGDRLCGRRIGLSAALILASSSLFFRYAQMARLESLFTFFVTLTIERWLAWRDDPQATPVRGWWIFAALGLAILVKGPMAFVFLVPVIGVDAFRYRDRRILRPAVLLPGIAITAALTALWIGPLVAEFGTETLARLFHDELVMRAKGEASFANPWWHYFATLPVELLPWTIFLPLAVWRLSIARAAPPPAFVCAWAALPFVLLELSGQRVARYLLPLFPAFALLFAISLDSLLEGDLDRGSRLILRCVPLLLVVLGLALPWQQALPLPATVAWTAGLMLVALAALLLVGSDTRLAHGSLAAAAAVLVLWQIADATWGAERRRQLGGSYETAATGLRAACGGRPVVGWLIEEESLEFYFARTIPEVLDAKALRSWLVAHPDGWVLARPGFAEPGFSVVEHARVSGGKHKTFVLLAVTSSGD